MSITASRLSRIAQIALSTRDLKTAVAFYRDVLGLTPAFEVSGMAFFDAAGISLMLGPAPFDGPVQPNTFVYFAVDDWAADEAALSARGLAFCGPVEVVQRHDGREHVMRPFKDPDGNILKIMGWRAAT